MEIAAKKNRLTADEAKVLFTLYQCGEVESMRRLSEVSDLPLPRLFLALQKLERKKLVEMSDEKGTGAADGADMTPEPVQEKADPDGTAEAGEKKKREKREKEKKEKEKKRKAEEKKAKKANRGRAEERKEKNRILLRPEAEQVCEEFRLMQEELKEICFAGFTDEERRAGEELLRRLNENMIRFMAKEA